MENQISNQLVIRKSEDVPMEWLPPSKLHDPRPETFGRKFEILNGRSAHFMEMMELACKSGVEDKSYNTVRYGGVAKFQGEAHIEYHGFKFRAVGYGPTGTPEFLSSRGGIVFYQE